MASMASFALMRVFVFVLHWYFLHIFSLCLLLSGARSKTHTVVAVVCTHTRHIMETYLFLTLAGIGWMLTKQRKQFQTDSSNSSNSSNPKITSLIDHQQRDQTSSTDASRGRVAYRGDAPSMNDAYESHAWERARRMEQSAANRSAADALDPARTNRVPPNDSAAVFVSPLTGKPMPMSEFTHNNMVPFFGGSVKQNTRDTAFTSQLETFTGLDPTVRKPKVESDPFFVPLANNANYGGVADDIRTSYLATMPPSRLKKHEQPMAMLVGKPGIANGETGDVYYDQRKYAQEKTVDQLRAATRPKTTYGGRVLPGEGNTAARMPIPQVVKEQTRQPMKVQNTADDFFRTTGARIAQTGRPDFVLPCTARQTTGANSFYLGPGGVASGVNRASVESDAQVSEPHRVTLCGPQLGPAAPATSSRVNDYGKSGTVAYPNERDITTTREYGRGNVLSSVVKALTAPFSDVFKHTRKEDMIDAPRLFGNIGPTGVAAQPKLTVYDANDVARTTRKETGLAEVPLINLRGTLRPGVAHDPDDVPRTTLKQTLLAESAQVNLYGGNVRKMLTVHDPDDLPATTMKEVSLRDGTYDGRLGGEGMGRRVYVRDPDVDAKTTIRDTLDCVDTNLNPSMSRAAGMVVDPDVWKTQYTLRDLQKRFGMTDGTEGSVGGLQNVGRQGAYTTTANDVKPTQKQTLSAAGVEYGIAQRPQGTDAGGYQVAPKDIKDTQKQTLSDNDYYGIGASAASGAAATSQEMDRALNMRNDRDIIAASLDVRPPTTEGPKAGTSLDKYGDSAQLDTQRTTTDYDSYKHVSSKPLQVVNAGLGQVSQETLPPELLEYQADSRFNSDVAGSSTQRAANPFVLPSFSGNM